MKTTIKTLAALIAILAAACAPCPPGTDVGLPQDGGVVADASPSSDAPCAAPVSAVVEEGSDFIVIQGQDSQGAPFQVGLVRVATSVEVTDSRMDRPHRLQLTINGLRQSTMVWGGRAVGMSRVVGGVAPVGNFCPGTMRGSLVQLGFGTVASTMPSEGLSIVGRQLWDGESISVRFDVCTIDGCAEGLTKQMTVRVR